MQELGLQATLKVELFFLNSLMFSISREVGGRRRRNWENNFSRRRNPTVLLQRDDFLLVVTGAALLKKAQDGIDSSFLLKKLNYCMCESKDGTGFWEKDDRT